MARITVEDCLQKVNNRFALIHLSAKRVRQLRRGAEPLVQSKNKDIVVSLREIAAGKVRKAEPEDLERLLEEAEAAEALPEGPAPAAEADTAPVVSQEEASSEKA
ncbi:MAG: DNA-directed RNA polymerase subunit omega [Deltaproteobacteria bacterium]|nr:DNA-directed RNA polymerase subunit omega [Deltaproteobacteria bacterium]